MLRRIVVVVVVVVVVIVVFIIIVVVITSFHIICTPTIFSKRVKELKESKTRLEGQLAETFRQWIDQEENIKNLRKAIADKVILMKLAQTRLDAGAQRFYICGIMIFATDFMNTFWPNEREYTDITMQCFYCVVMGFVTDELMDR